jgi:hypothetical protein
MASLSLILLCNLDMVFILLDFNVQDSPSQAGNG